MSTAHIFRDAPVFVRHVILWLVAALFLWLGWIGFIASDDGYYVAAARGWLYAFPYVGNHLGFTRNVVAIPIAAMIRLFGDNEIAASLSGCIFLAGTASITMAVLAKLIGESFAFVASGVLVTVPLFVLQTTIPSADLPELFFAVCSFWLFWIASQSDRSTLYLGASGASAALAFMAHETATALLVFYGLLFLGGKVMPRRAYWVMAAGFIFILALECAYYWIAAGNPMHRLSMLVGAAVSSGDRVQVGRFEFAAGGTIHIWAPLDPILMFFTKHEFGLLGFIAVPAMWWALGPNRGPTSPQRNAAFLMAGMSVVWFVFAAVVLNKLILLPRYYLIPAYGLFVVSAIWVATIVWPVRQKFVLGGLSLVVMTNAVAIMVPNKDPRFAERALVDYLRISSGDVHTDPVTKAKTEEYCRWAGVDWSRLRAAAPEPGIRFAHIAKNADRPSQLLPATQVAIYNADRSWPVVWEKQEPPRLLATLFGRSAIVAWVPPGLANKLLGTQQSVRVVMRPDD